MDNQFILDVDFKQSNYIDTPIITQNDTVTFIVNLLDENEPFDLSDVVTYTLSVLRSDGVSVISTGSKTDDSQATFELPRASIAIVGNGTATVQLYNSNGRVSTFKFDIKVVKDPSDYNPTGDEKTLIELVLGEGPQVIEDARNATTEAIEATDDARQATTDTNAVKDATEAVKDATEIIKSETQAVKEQAEQVISDTEEIAEATEQERLDTKAEREATESVRQSTEDVRDTTESVKNATESERIATQEEREKTQSERESTELVRQSAEELKGETESVKQSAEQATTAAITATGDAVNAAEYANAQGDYAKSQGDLITEIAKDGPVISVNGKTGIVEGVAEQEDLDDVAAQLADTALDNFTETKFLHMPEDYLKVPSPIGTNLTMHPSVVDFGASNKWNGYRYWMAHTPYPGTQNENPSISCSNDNKEWVDPVGVVNPLIPAPPSPAYNSDTEMVFIRETNSLRMYYREFSADKKARIYFLESVDGSNWTDPILSVETTDLALSPAIVRVDTDNWTMWTVESASVIKRRTSTDGITWREPSIVAQPWVDWAAWHFGVTLDSSGTYHMLASTYPDAGSGVGTQYRPIVYAHSTNGITWTPNEKPQLIPTGWAGGYLYRPHFLIDESKGLKDGLPYARVWFCATDDAVAAAWHTGFAEGYLLPGDKNASGTSETMKRKKIGEYFKMFASNIVAPFAKIARIRTKRVEITSDFSQPLLEWRDGRPSGGGSNHLREDYVGSGVASGIRSRKLYYDDEGNLYSITIQPHTPTPYISFNKLTDVSNIRQGKISEVIVSNGVRMYAAGSTSKFNRFSTNAVGETILNLTARDSQHSWKWSAGSGTCDAGGNALEKLKYIQLSVPMAIASTPNGTLFEDADGKLKYKNMSGVVTVLT